MSLSQKDLVLVQVLQELVELLDILDEKTALAALDNT